MGIFVAFAIALVGLAWIIGHSNRTPGLVTVVVIGLVARLSILVAALMGMPIPGMGGDDLMHHSVAEYDAMFGFESAFWNFKTGRHLYTWALSVIYSLIGPEKLVPISINLVAGVALIYVVYQLSFTLWGNRRTALMGAWIVSLFPNLAIYSMTIGREVIGSFLFAAGALAVVRSVRLHKETDLLAAAALFFLATLSHSGYVVALLIPVVLLFRRNLHGHRTAMMLIARSLVFAGSLALVSYIAISGRGLEKFTTTGADEDASLTEVVAKRQASRDIDNRAAYLTTMQPQNVVDLAWQTPVRIAYFLLTPFPWMITSVLDVFGFSLTALTTGLLCLVWRHRKTIYGRLEVRWLAILLGVIVSLFALGTSNYGTALRHRTKILPVLAAIVPVYAWRRKAEAPLRQRARPTILAPTGARRMIRQ